MAHFHTYPQIAFGGSGNALAVWQQEFVLTYAVYGG